MKVIKRVPLSTTRPPSFRSCRTDHVPTDANNTDNIPRINLHISYPSNNVYGGSRRSRAQGGVGFVPVSRTLAIAQGFQPRMTPLRDGRDHFPCPLAQWCIVRPVGCSITSTPSGIESSCELSTPSISRSARKGARPHQGRKAAGSVQAQRFRSCSALSPPGPSVGRSVTKVARSGQ
ncbi:hypothetical protein BV25DRAFT_792736 [Artomyces pyxidatus]|uniref:Uncharacterized protein n=1 Tax=Artomyces pyxidatus TaxID=48021 RepID=A0ACB8SY73_9AGAM|nr:hypothetical protein BV25DRAFT_792736 [Artomyces pyxidatus]